MPLQLIIFGAITLIVLASIMLSVYAGRRRKESLVELAARMGLAYAWTNDRLEPFKSFGLPLFERGRRARASHTLSGDAGSGKELLIADYSYTTGRGKNKHVARHTIVLISSDRLAVPGFCVRDESRFLDSIGELVGLGDIDFPEDPEFSKKFRLTRHGGSDEDVRRLFSPPLRQYFRGLSGVCIEGAGRSLLFYRPRGLISPEEIQPFVEAAKQACEAFESSR